MKNKKKLSRRQYYRYINSAEWRETKLRYISSKLPKICYVCEKSEGPFDLHHKTYKALGNENLTHLTLVCRECHNRIHQRQKDTGVHIWVATKKARTAKLRSNSRKEKKLKKNLRLEGAYISEQP